MWELFDTNAANSISKTEFIKLTRVLGRRYTDEQFAEKTKQLQAHVSYDDFLIFMRKPYTGPSKDDLLNALKAFDGKETGELTLSQLSSILTTMGEHMVDVDTNTVLEAVGFPTTGKLPIEVVAKGLDPPVPSAKPNIEQLMQVIMKEEIAKMGDIK